MNHDGQLDWQALAWSVGAVRAAEEHAFRTIPAETLMLRAAAGLAQHCAKLLRPRGVYGAKIVVLAGGGNNGGDALYAGAILARRGAAVSALIGEQVHRLALAAFQAAGGRVHQRVSGAVPLNASLIIDGLVGIGGRGGLRPELNELVAEVAKARTNGALVVAADIASGVDADSGHVAGGVISADVTVTFGCHKPGLHLSSGVIHSGRVELVDIGLRPYLMQSPVLCLSDAGQVATWWPRPAANDDKYSRGVLGIAAGSAMYPGAALLAVGGALAGPMGMVRYAGLSAETVVAAYPEVVATTAVAEAGRVQAWVCGPGLGTDIAALDSLQTILASDVPVLLDGDAITLLSTLDYDLPTRSAPTVLTPHDREFTRIAGPLGDDRLAQAQRAADALDATVLLKGNRTIVASPGQRPLVNPTGTPSLATAGSGDVLAGLIGSLLAAGVAPHRAAAAGAFAHGLAGQAVALRASVVASRLVIELPGVVQRLATNTERVV